MLFSIALGLLTYSKPVTALSLYGGSVYVGRADGVVERVTSDLKPQEAYSMPGDEPISFVSASVYGVAWLSGPGGAIREKVAPAKIASETLTIRSGDRSYSVLVQPSSPIRRLSWIGGRVAVSYDFGSSFFDAKAHVVDAKSFMPADAAILAKNSSLWVREQDDGTELALFARPYSVRRDPRNQRAPLVSLFTAYQIGAWQWVKLGGFASNAFDAFPDGELQATEEGRIAGDTKFMVLSDRVALSQDGIVAREPESLMSVPIFAQDWEISRLDAATIAGDPLWFGAGGDSAWWWNGAELVHQNRKSGQFEAYMPWVDDSSHRAFAADSSGLWIGTNAGLRRLDPAKPDNQLGYAGYIRAPFGVEATSSVDPNAKKLTEAVFAWRFADAEKAGADGGQMIASIFSVIGLQLPHTAAELMRAGAPVTDELRFGDVILTEKSAAVYLSNGVTVELRGGRVQNGDIWAYPKATVRRFAP